MMLAARCAALLPRGVIWAEADPKSPPTGMTRAEARCTVKAVPQRVAEFAAGRRAAHAALTGLGVAHPSVPMAADRSPIWPEGIAGSISHSEELCLAAVGWKRDVAAIGIDIEPDTELPAELIPEIAFGAELEWLRAQPSPGQAARRLFGIKESVYKCQYALTGRMLEFSDVAVKLDDKATTFSARVTGPVSGEITGRTLIAQNALIAAAWCPKDQVIANK